MPACVLWTLRWYPTRSVKLDYEGRSEAAKAEWQHGSLHNLVLLPLLPYLLWAIAYYIKVRSRTIDFSKYQYIHLDRLCEVLVAGSRQLHRTTCVVEWIRILNCHSGCHQKRALHIPQAYQQ